MSTTIPPAIAVIAPNGKLTTAQRRRFMLRMCLRRIKPGTGSGIEFSRRRTAMNPWPDLRPILKEIPWVIIGGVATRAYMPERATKDLDILIHHKDADEVLTRLKAVGYHVISRLAIPGVLLYSPEGVEVDVLFGDSSWLFEALSNSRQDPIGYPVLDLPYLVLMKMEASRSRDFGDLGTMLGLASEEELNRVRVVIRHHAPDMADDLESFIYLGKMEFDP